MIYSIPWFFFGRDKFFKSFNINLNHKSLLYFALFPYTFLRKLLNLLINYRRLTSINNLLLFKACCFNSFKLSEVHYYDKLGIKSWNKLSELIPNSQSAHFHSYKRYFLDYSCKEAIKILNNKRKIHLLTPNKFRPPYFFMDKNFQNSESHPVWWENSLKNNGIIVKPNKGWASRGIIKLFKEGEKFILNESLTSTNRTINLVKGELPTLNQIKDIWDKHFRTKEDLILMPIIDNNKIFPFSSSTVVNRIITEKKDNQTKIAISWTEVPISQNKTVIFDAKGRCLPLSINLNSEEKKLLSEWSDFLSDKASKNMFLEVFIASVNLHQRLPKINCVAWDWIISNNNNFLLEGNSSYGFLIPQLLNCFGDKI